MVIFLDTSYKWVLVDSLLLERARNLFEKYGLTKLRTLDAIQLASALKVRGVGHIFHTSDVFLRELFEKEGLVTELN